MSSLEAERAQAAGRARQRRLEEHAELFLNGRWTFQGRDAWEPIRQSAPLWMAAEAELLAAAVERWPEHDPVELVSVAKRLQGSSRKRQRHLDPRAYMTTTLEYAQSWIHKWRETHPKGTVDECWRAFELAQGVRKVSRPSFETYWGKAKPQVERLRDELRIPPTRNGEGVGYSEPRGVPANPLTEASKAGAEEAAVAAAERSPLLDVSLGLSMSLGLSCSSQLTVSGPRGHFRAVMREGGAWELELVLARATEEAVDQLFAVARRIVR